MMYKTIREFKNNELLFNNVETKMILKFIFRPSEHEIISTLEVTDRIRSFTQGLLIEAIDSSYAAGFVDAIFRASANPTAGVITVLKKFGKSASSHWFKNVTASDLQSIKVYQYILDEIARGSKTYLRTMLAKADEDEIFFVAKVNTEPKTKYVKQWG